jgi:hypothetical protein
MGKPSIYNTEIAGIICSRIAQGDSLRSICAEPEMPGLMTIMDWLNDEAKQEFRDRYARAREIQADVMDAKILEVADASTAESSPADRVKIAAYQWRAEKLKPKVYGQKTTHEIEGRLETQGSLADHEAAAKLAAILEAVKKREG